MCTHDSILVTEAREPLNHYLCTFDDHSTLSAIEVCCNVCNKHFCLHHHHHGCSGIDQATRDKERNKWEAPKRQFELAKAEADRPVKHLMRDWWIYCQLILFLFRRWLTLKSLVCFLPRAPCFPPHPPLLSFFPWSSICVTSSLTSCFHLNFSLHDRHFSVGLILKSSLGYYPSFIIRMLP